jgi:uncharacterized membrane protein
MNRTLTTRARFYIAATTVIGLSVLAAGMLFWQTSAVPLQYMAYFALALLGSTLKVRLPRITGTISLNFLFILIAIAEFTFSEAVTLAAAATLLQCLWRAKRRPTMVQLAFNVATLAVSAGLAFGFYRWMAANLPPSLIAVALALTACVLFLVNTLLVTGVISLAEQADYKRVWKQCYLWSVPYYIVGTVIATAIDLSTRYASWKMAMFLLPLTYVAYSYYRIFVHDSTSAEQPSLTRAAAAS